MKFLLNEMSWKEAEEAFRRTNIAIIPIGATHFHTHIPLGADTIIAEEIARRVGERTNVVVTPTISFGYTRYHDYPGNISVDPQNLYLIVMNVCESLSEWGVKKILFINGHGGNRSTLERVALDIRIKFGILSAIVEWWKLITEIEPKVLEAKKGLLEKDLHFEPNYLESSVLMAINPALIDQKEARIYTAKKIFGDEIVPQNIFYSKFENGTIEIILRDRDIDEAKEFFSAASQHVGDDILNKLVDYLVRFIKSFEKIEFPKKSG